jgi:Na+-translocating ferredoxin:NAD+ oxidoreductase RnfE subunit
MEPSMWHVRDIPWKAAYDPQVKECGRVWLVCLFVLELLREIWGISTVLWNFNKLFQSSNCGVSGKYFRLKLIVLLDQNNIGI